MAQPDPDRTASEVASAADGDSTTEDLPTTGDDNSSPMEDIGNNEDIPGDDIVDSTLAHEKLQPVRECPALVYMAKVSTNAAEVHKSYAQAVQYSLERTKHGPGYHYGMSAGRTQKAVQRCEKTQGWVYTQVQEGKAMAHARMHTQ